MKLAMGALLFVLIQWCISMCLVDCLPREKGSPAPPPPRPLLLEDPAGYYSLLFGNDTTTEGRPGDVPKPMNESNSNSSQVDDSKTPSSLGITLKNSTRNQEFLRRIRSGMYFPLGSTHSLAQFLLTNQRAFVCHDGKYCKMAKGTEGPFEPYLPEYSLFCTDREWLSPEDKQLVIYTIQFRLIPGVCFTRRQHLSFCDKPKIIFPTDSKCVTFFSGEDCSGEERATIHSGGLDILESAIVGAKSFAFC